MTKDEKRNIDARFEELQEKIEGLDKKILRVLFILESDSRTNEKGLVERVQTVERDIQEMKLREAIYKTKASMWGIVGGSIAAFLYWLGKIIILKILG